MNLNKLADKFAPEDVEWLAQNSGSSGSGNWCMVLCYITNRAIMDRLDEVCGVNNWKNEFQAGPMGGMMCGISIKIGDEWVTKYDGAEETKVEKTKGAYSASMKRAAVQWGIGRYLYKLEATFATCGAEKQYDNKAQTKDRKKFTWMTPQLPTWALPPPPTMTEYQVKTINDACVIKGFDFANICIAYKSSSICEIPSSKFNSIMDNLAKKEDKEES